MYCEVYLDVLFVLNGMMDYFLLRLVNRLCRGSAAPWRSLLGAGIGAGGLCLLVMRPTGRVMNTLLAYVIMNTIMVRFGCDLRKVRDLIKGGILLYAGAFLMGGAMQVLMRYTGTEGIRVFCLAGTVSYLATALGIRLYVQAEKKADSRVKVWLYADGKCQKGTALLDTGNSLRDPSSGKPVCIGEMKLLETLVGEETRMQLENFLEGKSGDGEFGNLQPHFLPFTSLGCTRGLALAVTIDYLYLESGETQKVITRPVIAFSRENGSFSGDYQLILHPNLIDS